MCVYIADGIERSGPLQEKITRKGSQLLRCISRSFFTRFAVFFSFFFTFLTFTVHPFRSLGSCFYKSIASTHILVVKLSARRPDFGRWLPPSDDDGGGGGCWNKRLREGGDCAPCSFSLCMVMNCWCLMWRELVVATICGVIINWSAAVVAERRGGGRGICRAVVGVARETGTEGLRGTVKSDLWGQTFVEQGLLPIYRNVYTCCAPLLSCHSSQLYKSVAKMGRPSNFRCTAQLFSLYYITYIYYTLSGGAYTCVVGRNGSGGLGFYSFFFLVGRKYTAKWEIQLLRKYNKRFVWRHTWRCRLYTYHLLDDFLMRLMDRRRPNGAYCSLRGSYWLMVLCICSRNGGFFWQRVGEEWDDRCQDHLATNEGTFCLLYTTSHCQLSDVY